MILQVNEVLKQINLVIENNKFYEHRFAAFDLDNTLLVDDIGEAVYAIYLKEFFSNSRSEMYLKWKKYKHGAKFDDTRYEAYTQIIREMNGLSVNDLERITNSIIHGVNKEIDKKNNCIHINKYKIKIPRPNKTMSILIEHLLSEGIDVYVITATNEISARIACREYFNIPKEKIIGAKLNITSNKNIEFNEGAVYPYAIGKVNAILEEIGKVKPIITAGDGLWDSHLLNYTSDTGIRLWLGSKTNYKKIKKNYHFEASNFIMIDRS